MNNERADRTVNAGIQVKPLAAILSIVALTLPVEIPTTASVAADRHLMHRFQTTPIFGNPVTLTKAEFAVAERWPITKVFLVKDLRTYLVLYRSEITTARTAAFFHWVAPQAGWQEDFSFEMREIDDAYWAHDRVPADLLARHRVPVSAEILTASQGALTRGYLRQGLSHPWLVLIYTDGKTFKDTEISYPLIEFEQIADGEGFVAMLGPPVIASEPGKVSPPT